LRLPVPHLPVLDPVSHCGRHMLTPARTFLQFLLFLTTTMPLYRPSILRRLPVLLILCHGLLPHALCHRSWAGSSYFLLPLFSWLAPIWRWALVRWHKLLQFTTTSFHPPPHYPPTLFHTLLQHISSLHLHGLDPPPLDSTVAFPTLPHTGLGTHPTTLPVPSSSFHASALAGHSPFLALYTSSHLQHAFLLPALHSFRDSSAGGATGLLYRLYRRHHHPHYHAFLSTTTSPAAAPS